MPTLLRDLRHSLRTLRKNPSFALLVVLSLALGIGANTAMFSAIDALMFRDLPVRNPQSLYLLKWSMKTRQIDPFMNNLEGDEDIDSKTGGSTSNSISYPAYQRIQTNNTVFSDTFGFAANEEDANLGLGGKASSAVLQGVSGNLFQSLGIAPILGRAILPSDDSLSAVPVAVISYAFWQSRLGGDASIVGKTVSLNGTPVTVVGIAPSGFSGMDPGVVPDMWIPLSVYADQWTKNNGMRDEPPLLSADKIWWLDVVGRLKPDVSVNRANAELAQVFNQSIRAYDAKLASDPDVPQMSVTSVATGLGHLREQYSQSLFLLMGMVVLVLLIACANIAGLLMARATSRQREIAMRISLGASRRNIMRQLLTESMLLAVTGGALALFVAHWTGLLLNALLASGRDPVHVTFLLDMHVLAFTAAVSICSGILCGLGPALTAIRVQPLTTLKQAGGNATASAKTFRSGKILVCGQIALSLLLLISAGLLLRTLGALQRVNLGFDRHSLLLFTVAPGLNGYSGPKLLSYYDELERRISTIHGVRSVAMTDRNPIGDGGSSTLVTIPGYTHDNQRVQAYRHHVGAGYFETLRIPVLLGRGINERDTPASQKVVVINQAFANKYFHGDNPLGHEVQFGSHVEPRGMQIVGVVSDVKYEHIRDEPPPTVYVAYTQTKEITPYMTYEVKSSGRMDAMVQAIQREALSVNPDVPVVKARTQDEVVSQSLYLERTFALLSSAFGALSLLLACMGVYGTIAYTVAQRTNEIGIRMALGAQRTSILRMVLRETITVLTAGLLIGLPLAWLSARLLREQIYGLSPHDPATLVMAIVGIAVVTIIAGLVPARRASKVDPLTALRYE
jgi:predicted permease